MSQSDLESQLEQLRQTSETTRRQLEATPGLTADMVEAMLAPLVQQIAALEERLGSTQYDQRQQQVGQQIIVQGDYHAAAPETTLDDPTALARYLALTYARDLKEKAGLVKRRLQLDERRLPLLLPLRDLARYLQLEHPDPGTDGPRLILDYLRAYFANQYIPLPESFFPDRLQRGQVVVLLDGVDEVADLALRHRVARLIERFTLAYPGNRYAVTSRVVGYTGSARLGEGYAVTTVRDFTQADVERFVAYWNQAVEVALAVNPLLLTVVALVQRYRAQLPERRTELYEEAVEVLLGKWDEAKGLVAKTMMAGRELDAGDRRALLEPVALWMMENKAREIEADELRRQLGRRFYEMTDDGRAASKAVDDFLRLINERSGLLAERGQGVYAFSHLTFQEHLAARAVSDKPDYIAYTLARLGDSWWRQVILLEAGYLSTQGKQRVTALIQAVMNDKEEPEPYHNLVLVAECLRDVGLARVECDLWNEVQHRLRREFERPLRQSAIMKGVSKALGRKTTQSDAVRRRAVAAVTARAVPIATGTARTTTGASVVFGWWSRVRRQKPARCSRCKSYTVKE